MPINMHQRKNTAIYSYWALSVIAALLDGILTSLYSTISSWRHQMTWSITMHNSTVLYINRYVWREIWVSTWYYSLSKSTSNDPVITAIGSNIAVYFRIYMHILVDLYYNWLRSISYNLYLDNQDETYIMLYN